MTSRAGLQDTLMLITSLKYKLVRCRAHNHSLRSMFPSSLSRTIITRCPLISELVESRIVLFDSLVVDDSF